MLFLQSKNKSDISGCDVEVQKLRNNLSKLKNEEIVINCSEEVYKLNDVLIYENILYIYIYNSK